MVHRRPSPVSSQDASVVAAEPLSQTALAQKIDRLTRSIIYCLLLVSLSLSLLSWSLPPVQSRPELLHVPRPGKPKSFPSPYKKKIVLDLDETAVVYDSKEEALLAAKDTTTIVYASKEDALQALGLQDVHFIDEEEDEAEEDEEDLADPVETSPIMFDTTDAAKSLELSSVSEEVNEEAAQVTERETGYGTSTTLLKQHEGESLDGNEYEVEPLLVEPIQDVEEVQQPTKEIEVVLVTEQVAEETETEGEPATEAAIEERATAHAQAAKETAQRDVPLPESKPTVPFQRQAALDECSVWIAPSSLKGVNGYGVFTTRDIAAGESILGGPDGLGVPVGHYHEEREPKAYERARWRELFDNYWWGRGVPSHVLFDSTRSVVDFQIGFGCLPNHHCVFDYLSTEYPNPAYDDTLADRFSQPSAGAFSYNRGREFFLSHDLEAGGEIFLNYGHCQRGEGKPEWLDHAFVTADFNQATSMILHHLSMRGTLQFDEEGNILVSDTTTDLVAQLLPHDRTEYEAMTKDLGDQNDLLRRVAKRSLNPRTPEWIRENGICMENLMAQRSTLPLAGQGAFAQFPIKKGEIVAPAPLMQVIDRDALILYDHEGKPAGMQLLMNYCFGSNETKMLLCPNTNAVLLNHCSTRTKECGPEGPNAEYRWSSGWDATTDAWLKMTIDEIAEQDGRGLAFEIVALRDIEPGEEVWIDYGREWEEAWARHVADWQPLPAPDEPWLAAKAANEMDGIPERFIAGDLRVIPRDDYLFVGCQYTVTGMDYHPVYNDARHDWALRPEKAILDRYADPFGLFGDGFSDGYASHGDGAYWPCTVIRKEEGEEEDTYTVRIFPRAYDGADGELAWAKNDLPRLITGYPRSLIHFFVVPFRGDHHLRSAFRHPIGIRDELLPPQWRTVDNEDKSQSDEQF